MSRLGAAGPTPKASKRPREAPAVVAKGPTAKKPKYPDELGAKGL